jgi:hypothetical protein
MYREEDELEDGAGLVSSPVGVADEGPDDGEDVGGAGPVVGLVGGVGVVQPHDHRHERHQVGPHAVDRERHQRLVRCTPAVVAVPYDNVAKKKNLKLAEEKTACARMKKKQYQKKKKTCHLFYPAARCRYVDLPSMRKPANHPPDLSLRHGLPLQPTDPSRVAVAVRAAAPPPCCFSWTTTCGRSSSTAGPCRRGSSAVGVQLPSCGFTHACMPSYSHRQRNAER